MQIIRTIIWVTLAVFALIFSWANWNEVTILIGADVYLTTKLPVLLLAAFLLGFLPMWLIHMAGRWSARRRISALEHSVRATAVAPPLATSTQLEAAQQQSEEPTV